MRVVAVATGRGRGRAGQALRGSFEFILQVVVPLLEQLLASTEEVGPALLAALIWFIREAEVLQCVVAGLVRIRRSRIGLEAAQLDDVSVCLRPALSGDPGLVRHTLPH